jgi:glucose-6-phosphate 1-epimerase
MKPCIEDIEFHGIPALRLHGPRGGSAVVSRFGAQLLSWITPDGRERLFLSEKAVFDGKQPIRGGVPVCFPQFADLGDLPKHGFLRTRDWDISARRASDDYALVTLEISDDEASRALWPHSFRAEMTVMLEADRIDLELSVTNTGGAEFTFSGALHTYLRVVQVEDVALEGLYGHDYRDATRDGVIVRDTGTEFRVESEVDRRYLRIRRPQLMHAGNLSLGIYSQGFPDVVVWNPWVDKCATLPDMAPDGWRHMLCVEAAITGLPEVLPAGEEWYGRQTLVVV